METNNNLYKLEYKKICDIVNDRNSDYMENTRKINKLLREYKEFINKHETEILDNYIYDENNNINKEIFRPITSRQLTCFQNMLKELKFNNIQGAYNELMDSIDSGIGYKKMYVSINECQLFFEITSKFLQLVLNNYEIECINTIIYYHLGYEIKTIEDAIKIFLENRKNVSNLINKMPKEHPARIHFEKISLNSKDFEKVLLKALVKISMYQMIRIHDSYTVLESESEVNNLAEYISNGHNIENLISYIERFQNLIIEKEIYFKVFYEYFKFNKNKYSEILEFLKKYEM